MKRWIATTISRGKPGLTLVDLLAALAILAAAGAVALSAAGSLPQRHAGLEAVSTLEHAVERARSVAVRAGGAWLRLGSTLAIEPNADSRAALATSRDLPRGWRAALDDDGEKIRFDEAGGAADAVLVLRDQDDLERRVRLNGALGEIERIAPGTGDGAW